MSDFETAINYVLQNEGGFVNNPNDPGKATKFGITLKTLQRARQREDLTVLDMQNLDVEEAKSIYERFYWSPAKLEDVSQPIATALLDICVNIGQFDAICLAQKSCGLLADGMNGPKTIQALNSVNMVDFFFSFVTELLHFYTDRVKSNPQLLGFMNGWVNRSMRLLTLTR